MNLAIITPIPDLKRFATRSRIHLVLAEWLRDSYYLDFYKYRGQVGDYLILDNGAHEHDGPLPMAQLMHWAAQLRPSEIVMPDVQRDGKATTKATNDAVAWLQENPGALEECCYPRLQIVPQGKTMIEWATCRWNQLAQMRSLGVTPIIGIAKHHEDLITGGIMRLVAECQKWHDDLQVHLLGWPRRLHSVVEVERAYPGVRSIDTARPLVFAKWGMEPDEHPDPMSNRYPDRDVEFFTEPVSTEYRELAHRNIDWFQHAASGVKIRGAA